MQQVSVLAEYLMLEQGSAEKLMLKQEIGSLQIELAIIKRNFTIQCENILFFFSL